MKDLEFIKEYFKENNITYIQTPNNKVSLFEINEIKFLFLSDYYGNEFNFNKSIKLSDHQNNFLEKNKDYKVLFFISEVLFFSKVKELRLNKNNDIECFVDFKIFENNYKNENLINFVHLHNHFEYSALDGTLNCKEWLKECNKKGFSSLGLTDHGTLAGILEFYLASKDFNVKPILGLEAYITDDLKEAGYQHLTLLAKNNEGWNSLLKLNSFANLEGFYFKPRMTYDFLLENSKGLIILTGCSTSKFYKLLVNEDFDNAIKLYKFYCKCVGEENLYLEFQNHLFSSDKIDNQNKFQKNFFLIRKKLIKKGMNPKIVLTNDSHYPNEKDFVVFKSLSMLSKDSKGDNNLLEDLYLKTRKELFSDFKNTKVYKNKIATIEDFKEMCENTIKISKECNVNFETDKFYLPQFKSPKKYKNNEEYFDEIVKNGFDKKIVKCWKPKVNAVLNDYKIRVKKEIEVIKKADFVDYFLIVWDIVNYAKENDIPVGMARGSVAGSLVSYCMSITEIDPIQFNLLFERFLNEGRFLKEEFLEIELENNKKIKLEINKNIVCNNKNKIVKDLKVGDDIKI